uniref:Uncharacterized protein n=1 Tax=Globodera rostochiensis TaxID=31243 RepID=A0A914IA46_GLORO
MVVTLCMAPLDDRFLVRLPGQNYSVAEPEVMQLVSHSISTFEVPRQRFSYTDKTAMDNEQTPEQVFANFAHLDHCIDGVSQNSVHWKDTLLNAVAQMFGSQTERGLQILDMANKVIAAGELRFLNSTKATDTAFSDAIFLLLTRIDSTYATEAFLRVVQKAMSDQTERREEKIVEENWQGALDSSRKIMKFACRASNKVWDEIINVKVEESAFKKRVFSVIVQQQTESERMRMCIPTSVEVNGWRAANNMQLEFVREMSNAFSAPGMSIQCVAQRWEIQLLREQLAQKDEQLAQKNEQLAQKDETIQERDARINKLLKEAQDAKIAQQTSSSLACGPSTK